VIARHEDFRCDRRDKIALFKAYVDNEVLRLNIKVTTVHNKIEWIQVID
jgi:hypothetical protein